jgi:hypothetical protein
MGQTIEIDDEVLEELGRRARPFIDTEPNDVIRAMLELDAQEDEDKSTRVVDFTSAPGQGRSRRRNAGRSGRPAGPRKRARKGTLLDERAYEIPILRALDERDGRAATREVVDRVGELVDDQLTPLDRQKLDTGGIRWEARVQFARLRMKEQGFLNPDSPRGVWEITDKGRDRLRQETTTAA